MLTCLEDKFMWLSDENGIQHATLSTTSTYFPFFCNDLSLHLACFGIRAKLLVIAYDIKEPTLDIIKYFAEYIVVFVVFL